MTNLKWYRVGAGVCASVLVTMLLASAGTASPKRAQQAPVITSVEPTSGAVGTVVIISGSDLLDPTISFNKVVAPTPATPEFTNSATRITALVPPGATTGPITVTTSGGSVTTSSNFVVTASPPKPTTKPVISRFSPTTGKPGTMITITGSNFANLTAVKFGGIKAKTVKAISKQRLSAKVPVGARSGRIAVSTVLGTAMSTEPFAVK